MSTVMSWLGFFGVWLLLGGAIYQAALELRAHELAADRIEAAGASISAPPKISAWWWLVPPVKFMLERKRAMQFRKAYVEAMPVEDFAALLAFFNKATGWLLVALGGLTLAVKETYQFTCDRHCGLAIFGALVVGMIVACVAGSFIRLSAGERLLMLKRGETSKRSARIPRLP